jgi:hypothetical protein
MSSPDFFQKIAAFLRRRWADVLASDLAAGHDFEPELPASAFVHVEGNPPPRAAQAIGAAARQRSARISINKG